MPMTVQNGLDSPKVVTLKALIDMKAMCVFGAILGDKGHHIPAGIADGVVSSYNRGENTIYMSKVALMHIANEEIALPVQLEGGAISYYDMYTTASLIAQDAISKLEFECRVKATPRITLSPVKDTQILKLLSSLGGGGIGSA